MGGEGGLGRENEFRVRKERRSANTGQEDRGKKEEEEKEGEEEEEEEEEEGKRRKKKEEKRRSKKRRRRGQKEKNSKRVYHLPSRRCVSLLSFQEKRRKSMGNGKKASRNGTSPA